MKLRIYIESSVPSFYYEPRPEAEMVARRNWTRQWWDDRRKMYELVTSDAVIDELAAGSYSTQKEVCALVADIPLLPMEPAIADIVEAY